MVVYTGGAFGWQWWSGMAVVAVRGGSDGVWWLWRRVVEVVACMLVGGVVVYDSYGGGWQ